MVLGLDELEPIIEEALDEVRRNLLSANRNGKLEDYLGTLGLDGLIQKEDADSFSYKNGMIVVLGASRVRKKELIGIGRSLELNRDRFEFCLDYGEMKSYPFGKLQHNAKYRVVFVGPVPHSSSGICCLLGKLSSELVDTFMNNSLHKIWALKEVSTWQ